MGGAVRDALKRWTRKRVIDAWHGALTRGQIALRSGYSRSGISALWADAKAAGELPQTDRPHFPQGRRKIAPERKAKRDTIEVRSLQPASGWPEIVTDILQKLARLPEEERIAAAEVVLAALVCGYGVHGQERFFKADLASMHVMAHVRRHASGERPLPAVASHRDLDRSSLGTFADPCIVHLHHSSNVGPHS